MKEVLSIALFSIYFRAKFVVVYNSICTHLTLIELCFDLFLFIFDFEQVVLYFLSTNFRNLHDFFIYSTLRI